MFIKVENIFDIVVLVNFTYLIKINNKSET